MSMSPSFGPFSVGDKGVAVIDCQADGQLSAPVVKGCTYTIRDWHLGFVLNTAGERLYGQIVNVVGIQGEMVPLLLDSAGQPATMTEYGWWHETFRKVWTQTESASASATVTTSVSQPAASP